MTPHELRTRLALDARVVARLRSPHLGAIRGFVSPTQLERRAPATEAELAGGRATYWTVEYRFPMLAGPGRTLPSATAVFNLLAGGSYPDTPPTVTFVSRPFPWCGHVMPSNGSVCLGEEWCRAQGQILLAHLVVHVMRLANFHEPPADDGNNEEALRYGRDVLKGRPLHPDLTYPALPADLIHGVGDDDEAPEPFASAFLPRGVVAPGGPPFTAGLFRPREGVAPQASTGFFLPRAVRG
jgi:hypothetical protein